MASIAEAIICEIKKGLSGEEERRTIRTNIEPYIYNYLNQKFYTKLQSHWETYMPPLQSKQAYVIVERRCHPNFDFVLKNIAWANPNMSIYIFCSDYNEKFVYSLLGDKVKNVNIILAFSGEGTNIGVKDYNKLLCSKEFYERFHPYTEYILTIQMDVFIRRKFNDIFVGDYWGAPWQWKEEAAGGGGATVRKVSTMLDICKNNINDEGYPEDSWFSEKVAEMGCYLPDIEFRTRIMESLFVEDPIIVHQFWTFISSMLDESFSDTVSYIEKILTIEI
jgi:hypothetical protein